MLDFLPADAVATVTRVARKTKISQGSETPGGAVAVADAGGRK